MDQKKLFGAIVSGLVELSHSEPNERLPKEEHIRALVFSELQEQYDYVAAERNYKSVDTSPMGPGPRAAECDIWFKNREPGNWMEMKRCWSGKGWNNKPAEQLDTWKKDLKKLNMVKEGHRYFLLVGLFDFDPLKEGGKYPKVLENIEELCPDNLERDFSQGDIYWRKSNISHLGIWLWHWKPGERISIK